MKIWHIGASASPRRVSGLNIAVWVLAREQAQQGHDVSIVVHARPDQAGLELAKESGFELVYIPSSTWRYQPGVLLPLLRDRPPDVVHMHSVFQPKHASLAKQLKRHRIPYVINPAGGLLPPVLQRDRLQKSLYSWLIEKPRFRNAAGVAVVTPNEEQDVRAFVPGYQGVIQWLSNPVDVDRPVGQSWQGVGQQKRVVYLGRFDVLHKGIDILVAIARHLPEVEFHLYGADAENTKDWLNRIKQDLPPNVEFRRPVFGAEKFRVLTEASLYIHTARWEVFGISIAEAMYLGTPCAIANTINFAELFQQYDLGLVLASNPQEAAAQLAVALDQPTQLQHWSKQAQAFAHTYFHPPAVAMNYVKFYEEVVATP
jgi:glycosyltransferase involved in cell wall biosynthesis